MSDNFDYRKDSIRFEDLLPDYFKNDINVSTFSNGIDRLLTPEDSVYVQGKIGKQLPATGTPDPANTNISEDSLLRSTWQLQPVLYSTIGTKEYITAYQDILNKLTRLGVDTSRQDKWIECDQFNFAPPIDIDKFINYRDYFWVENSSPDYITLNNDVTRANSIIFEIENGPETTTKQASIDAAIEQRNKAQAKIDNGLNKQNHIDNTISTKYQWIDSNKWIHRSELVGHNYATQAKLPIIEYFSNLEINTWTYTKHNWKYRASLVSDWVSVDEGPSEQELHSRFPIVNQTKNTFVVKNDVTKLFSSIQYVTVVDSSSNDGSHKIHSVTYDSTSKLTTITTEYVHSVTPSVYVNSYSDTEYYGDTGNFYGVIVPFTTSKFGDNWKGLFTHWLLDSVESTVPVNRQNKNPNQKSFTYVVPDYGYDVPHYDGSSGNIQFGYDGQSRFTFDVNYVLDTDDIQVYLNGVRQYGTYSESVNVDNRGRYDAEPYNSSKFDTPRHPNEVLSNSINFNKPLYPNDVVVVKVGPASIDDLTNYAAVVRYKDSFGVVSTSVRNLTQYRYHEQVKSDINQYILFDIYNVDGTTNYSANELFKYHEDLTVSVNSDLNKRIKISHNDFQFNNLLIHDSKLLCYKEYSNGEILNTIWRKSSIKYTPKKVDLYRKTDSQLDKEWEIPETLRCNIVHECRSDITFRELYTHLKGIISSQTPPKTYISSDRVCKLLPKLDYIGGNIKEHNGNFDYLVSSLHQDIVSYPAIIDFAKNKYAENLHDLRLLCINRTAYFAEINKSLTHDLAIKAISSNIITEFTNNLLLDTTYFDSTSYQNNTGVKNWIATLPILGLYPKYEPMVFVDVKTSTNKLRHHDGHMSNIAISSLEFDTFSKTFKFNESIENGNFKYDVATNTIKRCFVNYIQHNDPTISSTVSIGNTWYNLDTLHLLQYSGTSWLSVDVSNAWTTFDAVNIIKEAVLSLEQKLYERAKLSTVKINYNDIINDEPSLFIDYMKTRYLTYLKTIGELVTPMEFVDSNTFTWNYIGIDSPVFPVGHAKAGQPQITINYQRSQNWAAFWWQIYEYQYGTPYPHLEPWKLQGYTEKPYQWDNVYGATVANPGCKWKPVMWQNIRNGVIDSSLPRPLIMPPKYSILSVNDTGATQGVYAPDDLLPPYTANAILNPNNSLISFNDVTVVRPDTVYAPAQFGYQGTQERQWRESIDYSYDLFHALFRLQPTKTIQSTFGGDFYNVNGLVVDAITQNVPSYKNTIFHGSSYNGSTYLINGVNQWYINALRTSNNKAGIDDFTSLWSQWYPALTYQTNSVIKDSTVVIDNKIFDLTRNDYKVRMKRTPSSTSQWLHSLRISLYNYGSYAINTYNVKQPTNDDWQFRIDTLVPDGPELSYYGPRQYNINSVDVISNTFTFDSSLTIPWTSENNVTIRYNGVLLSDSKSYKVVPLGSNKFSLMGYNNLLRQYEPVDLYDSINCYCYSNTIPDNGYTFNSLTNEIVHYSTVLHMSGSVTTSTNTVVLRDYDLKYNVDTNTLTQYRITSGKWISVAANTFVLPVIHDNVYLYDGSKLLINTVDYTVDNNYKTIKLLTPIKSLSVYIAIPNDTIIEEKSDSFTVSTTSGKVTWTHLQIDKSNPVKKLTVPGVITGIQNVISFIDGYSNYLMDHGFSFNDYSRPLNDPTTGTMMLWQTEIEKFVNKVYKGFNLKFDKSYDANTQSVSIYDYVDINPFKYEFWINTPQGIVSNILTGPYKDINSYPIVYDGTGQSITSTDELKIYRTDKESHVTYNLTSKNYIGGMHMFVDYFEHVITFNDYTTNNNLIFDPFLGLNNEQLTIAFNKHYESTKRPNIGGGFLVNGQIVDNMESTANTLSQFYDLRADESNSHITESRNLLGYDNEPYLNSLNSKSKFLFWNGMVHHKGTNNSVNKFINLDTGDTVLLDEMWMYKLDTYGNNDPTREMYINIFPSDIVKDKLMYQLTSVSTDANFTTINYDDVTRWKQLPDIDNTNIFDFVEVGTARIIIDQYANTSAPKSNTTSVTLTNSKYISLPLICDNVEIYVERNYDQIITKTSPYNSSTDTVYSPYAVEILPYVLGVNMLTVLVNGTILPNTSYKEIDETHIDIPILQRYVKPATVTVMYNRGKLVDGTHYKILSNDLILLYDIVDWTQCSVIDISMKRLDTSTTSIKVVDTVNDIVVSSSDIYNPAYNVFHKSINNVTFVREDDPANYQEAFWSNEHCGEKWVDTYDLSYTRYNDTQQYPNIFNQIEAWGTTNKWSHITCYEWIASDIPPYEWANNLGLYNIAAGRNYVGKPLTILQKCVRPTIYDDYSDWYTEVNTYQYINPFEYTLDNNQLTFNVTLTIDANWDSFGIYVNNEKNRSYTFTTISVDGGLPILETITIPNIQPSDKITLIRFADTPDLSIEPTDVDLAMYRESYKYNMVSTYDPTGTSVTNTYYYWVTNQVERSAPHYTVTPVQSHISNGGVTSTSSRDNNALSTIDIEREFVDNTNIFTLILPGNKIIVKNIDKIITNNNYALQIIKNPALTTEKRTIDVNTHERHTEWFTIRKHSLVKIPIELWVKLTETLTGKTQTGDMIPSYNRILFDNANSTSTRFGFKPGQALGPRDLVLSTLIDVINKDDFDVTPIDKDEFISSNKFDTNANIVKTMNYMYTNFTALNINEIFFEIIHILYASNKAVDDVVKTSMATLDCSLSFKIG